MPEIITVSVIHARFRTLPPSPAPPPPICIYWWFGESSIGLFLFLKTKKIFFNECKRRKLLRMLRFFVPFCETERCECKPWFSWQNHEAWQEVAFFDNKISKNRNGKLCITQQNSWYVDSHSCFLTVIWRTEILLANETLKPD